MELQPSKSIPGKQMKCSPWRFIPRPGSPTLAQHNKRMQSDQIVRYALNLAADAGRYALDRISNA